MRFHMSPSVTTARYSGVYISKATIILLFSCIILALVSYLQFNYIPYVRPDVGSPQAVTGTSPTPDLSFQFSSLSEFTEIEARPLFTPSRRSIPEEIASALTSVETDQFWLRGLIITEERRIALLERRTTNEVLRITLNQTVDGWRAVSIMPGTVVLEQNNTKVVLTTTETLMSNNNQANINMNVEPWNVYHNDGVFEDYMEDEFEGYLNDEAEMLRLDDNENTSLNYAGYIL
jgi:hypothetical protein